MTDQPAIDADAVDWPMVPADDREPANPASDGPPPEPTSADTAAPTATVTPSAAGTPADPTSIDASPAADRIGLDVPGMPADPAPPADEPPGSRPADPVRRDQPVAAHEADDLRIAHLLLRSGNILPARVQLETAVARHPLPIPSLLDLAESRWRSGDLGGAGDAVAAYLDAGGEDALGYLIGAEAESGNGRPGEARKLARSALERLTVPLDSVFAGQARSSVWPHDPSAPVQPAGTLFAPPSTAAAKGGRIGLTRDTRPGPARDGAAGPRRQGGQWAGDNTPVGSAADHAGSAGGDPPPESQPDRSLWEAARPAPASSAAADLDAARESLAANDLRGAAVQLAIVLRLSPALAPVVLDLVGQLPGPDFDLVRGDALRLVGREAAAKRAFASAAEAVRDSPEPRSPE